MSATGAGGGPQDRAAAPKGRQPHRAAAKDSSTQGQTAEEGLPIKAGCYIDDATLMRIRQRMPRHWRLLMDYMTETGLRLSDALSLTRAQIGAGRSWLVVERKTGKERWIIVSGDLYGRLVQHAQRHATYVWERYRAGKRGQYSRWAMTEYLRKVCRRLDLPSTYTVHSLRRVYAVRLLRSGHTLEQIQLALNHRYLGTTLVYLQDALMASVTPLTPSDP